MLVEKKCWLKNCWLKFVFVEQKLWLKKIAVKNNWSESFQVKNKI